MCVWRRCLRFHFSFIGMLHWGLDIQHTVFKSTLPMFNLWLLLQAKSPLEKLFFFFWEAVSSPASVVFVLSSLAATKLSELWFSSLRTQHAGCFDADLCAHRNEGRDEEQMACDDGPPSPRAAFRHGSRYWREDECRDHGGEKGGGGVEVCVCGGGGAGLHEFDCLIRLYFMVCQAK